MSVHVFGQIGDVAVVEVAIASKAGASAKILNWGAVLRDLVVPSAQGPQRVTLGLNSIEDYLAHSPSFGAVPGRFANRIANGRFALDGAVYELARKPGEKHTLHGGPNGFGRKLWKLGRHDASSVTLVLEFGRRRRRLSRRLDRDLRLPAPGARDPARRTHRAVRSADDREPHPARLFQSRRIERRARPRIDAGVRLLHADRRRADPHRRDPLGRGDAFRLSPGAPDSPSLGPDLRHEFRRLARARRDRAGADRQAALAAQRPDVGAAQHGAGRAGLRRGQAELPGAGPRAAPITARTPASASSRRRSRIRPIAAISALACCGPRANTAT